MTFIDFSPGYGVVVDKREDERPAVGAGAQRVGGVDRAA